MTQKQQAIFYYIKTYISQKKLSPTFDEIANHFNYKSKGTVYKHVKALKQKGLIRQNFNRTRSIQLTKSQEMNTEQLPVKGEWVTGQINWAKQPYIYMNVPPGIVHNNYSYIIIIQTDELENDHIINKDFLIVQQNTSKKTSGKIIMEDKNGRAKLILNRETAQKYNKGQITGVFRIL